MSTDFKNKYNFLNDEFWQDFISKNYKNPVDKILFSLNQKLEVDSGILANQLKARQIIETKIPSWQNHKNLIFPKQLSMEQCSSEHTALYKSKICTGECCIDLTGGLGIDSFFISKSFKKTIHCEKNLELQFIAQHNFECLQAKVESHFTDGIEYLKHTNQIFDLIYIDPSRRNENNTKVVRLEEYTPNIIQHLNLLLEKGKQILVKTSPLLDIKQAIEQLPQLKEIHVIAVNNECKELLFLIDANSSKKQTSIICKDLVKDFIKSYLKNDDINEILRKAENIENNSNQLLNYTNIIKNNSLEIKKDIIEHLWKVIISDNTVDQYESNLMRRICGLIYFSDKECGEIKLKLINNK